MTGSNRRGTVVAFDEAVGLGDVQAPDGSVFRFHCTQIADGTRTIAEGTEVAFEVRPGRLGQWEAGAIRPLPLPSAPGS